MNDELRTSRREQFTRIFCLVLAAVLAYKWQRTFFAVCTGGVFSDAPLHIELALGHNDYSLSSAIIRLLYALGDAHFAQTALSLLLAANNVLEIATLFALLRYLLPELKGCYALLAAELALLCGPWLIPGYQTEIYLGAHNGNLYHNMTVLFSRTLIPLCLICFFRCHDARHGKLPWGSLLGFTATMLIITLFKPNFAFAFLPMLAVMLLYDFIKYRGRYLKNELLTGCAVIPAGLTCIWQYLVLYDESFAGTSSGMAIQSYTAAAFGAMLVMYLRSLLLPVYAIGIQGRKEQSRRHIGLLMVCEGIALAEASFLTETGYRANHGNFDWGALALYPVVFALAIALLFRMIQRANLRKPKDAALCALGVILLLGHLAVGVYFLYAFNAGYSYLI